MKKLVLLSTASVLLGLGVTTLSASPDTEPKPRSNTVLSLTPSTSEAVATETSETLAAPTQETEVPDNTSPTSTSQPAPASSPTSAVEPTPQEVTVVVESERMEKTANEHRYYCDLTYSDNTVATTYYSKSTTNITLSPGYCDHYLGQPKS